MCCGGDSVNVVEVNLNEMIKEKEKEKDNSGEYDELMEKKYNAALEEKFLNYRKKDLIELVEQYTKKGKNEEAIDIYNYLINKYPNNIDNYFNLGKLYMNMELYNLMLIWLG